MQQTREIKYLPRIPLASVTTDTGCLRETNEDNGVHVKPGDEETRKLRGTLTVVADGMGGHSSGEVASQMAMDLIVQFYYADAQNTVAEALRNAIQQANAEIFQTSVTDEKYYGMGTTLVALILLDGIGYTAHVGDSRLYRLRNNQIELLTMDHSQVMEMVKEGIISMEEARHHEDKNVILRAVGTQLTVNVEVSEAFEVLPNDEFLLCSDGLSDMVEDEIIASVWANSGDVYEASEKLVAIAKDFGGHDNITAAVVKIPAEDEFFVARKAPVTRELGV